MLMRKLEAFRSNRQLAPLNKVMKEVIDGLAKPENVALWREGIEKFNPETGSEAFSNYAGFRNQMVSRAAEVVSGGNFNGDARYAANDLEETLDPRRVAAYINQVPVGATPEQTKVLAAEFFNTNHQAVVQQRQALFQPENNARRMSVG